MRDCVSVLYKFFDSPNEPRFRHDWNRNSENCPNRLELRNAIVRTVRRKECVVERLQRSRRLKASHQI